MRRRLASAGAAGVVVVAVAAVGVTILTGTSGVTLNPGDSWNAAYQAAAPGDTITVAAGTHGSQIVLRQGVKSPPVIFAGSGGTVSVSLQMGRNTVLGPLGIELRDLVVSGSISTAFSEDVTLRNVKVQSLFQNGGTKRFSMIGGEVGPMPVNAYIGINTCTGTVPTQCISNAGTLDTLYDGVYIHDATVADNPNNEIHGQCMQVNSTGGSIDGLTIRNSVLQNCSDFGILGYAKQSNVVIENNFIDRPMPADPAYQGGGGATSGCNPNCVRDGFSLDIDGAGTQLTNIVVRYNSALGGMRIRGGNATSSNLSMTGNIMRASGCAMGTYRYNISNAQTCGTGDFNVANFWDVLWVDGNPQDGAMDFHLKAGVAAIDRGDSLSFPALDIDGQSRSGVPDVGADELGGAAPPPPTTTTEPPPTTTEPPPTTTEPPPTTTEPPPVDPDRTIFCSEYVPAIQAVPYYSKWATQNSSERSRWEPFRDGVCSGGSPTPPTMTTNFGKALVAAGKEAL